MKPERIESTAQADGQLGRSEIMAIGHAELADLLVKLCQTDPNLNALLRGLKPQRHGQTAAERPSSAFAEPFMVGESPAMKAVFEAIRRFARTDAPVLIEGESGTGKELAAQAIHERSDASAGPFVAINCGGLPSSLVASELFGHEKGAFTGAHQRKIGKIEAANGGTLMLDEIGDMPLDLQPHLLRFLQELTIERVGSNKPVPLTLRVLAATNHKLEEQVRRGAFREDLFHRLNCLRLDIPPLRQRGDDIILLAKFFVRRFSAEMDRGDYRLSSPAVEAIRLYSWPGNVRELISRVRRAIVMADDPLLSPRNLGLDGNAIPDSANDHAAGQATERAAPPDSEEISRRPTDCRTTTLEQVKARVEERMVRESLGRHAQNVTSTARALGVSRVTLYRLIDKYHIRSRAAPTRAN
ncbi:sigma-54 dependent transcriptional regulator [Pelagibius sp. CAU 1746]|uniref:sigma-54 interaction domain-containing protein n=1 Tax=Pelagibius sp. CAU 1746 TaxID=3140370 RepID=UPI00325AF317